MTTRTLHEGRLSRVGAIALLLGMLVVLIPLAGWNSPADAAPVEDCSELTFQAGRVIDQVILETAEGLTVDTNDAGTTCEKVDNTLRVAVAGNPVEIEDGITDAPNLHTSCSVDYDGVQFTLDGETYTISDHEFDVSNFPGGSAGTCPDIDEVDELAPVAVTEAVCGTETTIALPSDSVGITYSNDGVSDGVGTVTAAAQGDYTLIDDVDNGWVLANDGLSAEFTYVYENRLNEDCSPPQGEPTPTTASFDFVGECAANLPVLTGEVEVDEGDQPFDGAQLTVSLNDEVIEEFAVDEGEVGPLELPTSANTQTVVLAWDFDDATQEVTLPLNDGLGCEEVQGVVLDKPDPEPAPEPEPESKPAPVVLDTAEELPATGATSDVLLIWAGALLALGCGLLLTDRRLAARAGR